MDQSVSVNSYKCLAIVKINTCPPQLVTYLNGLYPQPTDHKRFYLYPTLELFILLDGFYPTAFDLVIIYSHGK